MSEIVSDNRTTPGDIELLLRAHAELRCLTREVLPVLRELETRSELPDDQVGAALTYLEFSWLEARRHALETDSARLALGEDSVPAPSSTKPLSSNACRYCNGVRQLRSAVSSRVERLLADGEAEIEAVPVIRRLDGRWSPEWTASASAARDGHGSP